MRAPRSSALVVALWTALTGGGTTAAVTIRNDRPWHDVNGALMDLHDGMITRWTHSRDPKLWWWYGIGYGDFAEGVTGCSNQSATAAGFRNDHVLSVYTSPNLADWTLVRKNAFPIEGRPNGIYFRPKLIWSASADRYVLWINRMDWPAPYHIGHYVTATSDSPAGPFQLANPNVDMVESRGIYCDFDILATDTGDAFIVYTVWRPIGEPTQLTHIRVERLVDDYLSSSGVATPVFIPPAGHRHPGGADEAPALFYRRGWYYLLFGHGCCFCAGGSGASVFTARHPLGQWTNTNSTYDIGCVGNDISNCAGSTNSQQAGISRYPPSRIKPGSCFVHHSLTTARRRSRAYLGYQATRSCGGGTSGKQHLTVSSRTI